MASPDEATVIFLLLLHAFARAGSLPTFPTTPSTAFGQPAPAEPGVGLDEASLQRADELLAATGRLLPPLPTRGDAEVALFSQRAPAVVAVWLLDPSGAPTSLGAGLVVGAQGEIVTNAHVVDGRALVHVVLYEGPGRPPGEVRAARVLRVDDGRDLALLQLVLPPDRPLTVAPVDAAVPIQIGQDVHAIGHPLGELWSYTTGIVSQVRADYEWGDGVGGANHRARVVQTQTPINPGNSGGPLFDDAGKLVGINAFGRADSVGLNFAVAVDEVAAFLAAPVPAVPPAFHKEPVGALPPKVVDVDGDGVGDEVRLDIDGDGRVDQVQRDTNGDRRADVLGEDTDRDGGIDTWLVDRDGDGAPEFLLLDPDQDGTPDLVRDLDAP